MPVSKPALALSAYFFQNRIPAESFFFLQLIPRTAVFPDKLICHMLNHTFFSVSIVHLDIRYHSIIIFRIHGTVLFHFQMVQIVCDCFDFLYIGQLIPRFSRSGRYGDPSNRIFRAKNLLLSAAEPPPGIHLRLSPDHIAVCSGSA